MPRIRHVYLSDQVRRAASQRLQSSFFSSTSAQAVGAQAVIGAQAVKFAQAVGAQAVTCAHAVGAQAVAWAQAVGAQAVI